MSTLAIFIMMVLIIVIAAIFISLIHWASESKWKMPDSFYDYYDDDEEDEAEEDWR
jgi:hypothetical protein